MAQPEPGSNAAMAKEHLRATLLNFYAAHNPEKCSSVDVILERFAGNTGQLILELEKVIQRTNSHDFQHFNQQTSIFIVCRLSLALEIRH
jgi:hypothetical protein